MTAELLLDLTRRYCEPHRHYHSLPHIAGMLHAGRALQLDDAQTFAIWFHDAIYDATSKTNEEDSASLALSQLTAAGWPRQEIDRVCRIVLDTKRHEPTTPDSAPVLDLDLMSLAAPWAEFTHNTELIRREYAHVADADFAAGRRNFFTAMLQRERLFYTPFGEPLEPLARANLLRAMQSGSST